MPAKQDIHKQYEADSSTGCWNWNGRIDANGYGEVGRRNGTRKAHRAIYEELRGPISGGLDLDHLCRNHRCVNPDHLEPVSKAENTRRGLSAKLTIRHVEEIRQRYADGNYTLQSLATEYGISPSNVGAIVTGKTWNSEIEHPLLSINNRNRIGASRRKLSDEQVANMRQRFANGETNCSELGRQYGVSDEQARRIVRGLQRA